MKKLLSLMTCAALLLTGCSKELEVKVVDTLTVEYGEKLDNSKLFNAKESDEGVKVDKVNGYDAKKLGEQTLKVTFTDGDKSTEKEVKVTVEDTKKPEITLKKGSMSITAGDRLSLKDNVKSVKDPVDGDLKYSDKEIKKAGYYIDKGKLDTKKAGTYTVTVKALDNNGNVAEKDFKVIVKKKEVASTNNDATYTQDSQGNAASPGTTAAAGSGNSGSSGSSSTSSGNSGSQSNSNSSSTSKPVSKPASKPASKPVEQAPHQHISPYPTGYSDAYSPGVWVNSIEDVDAFADTYRGPNSDWSGFQYSAVQCTCGMYAPYFFNIRTWE